MPQPDVDVVVVGAGPNGFAASIALARAGLRTTLLESRSSPGGGARTEELTLPGFLHDVCSAVHPMGLCSPFFRKLQLDRYGLKWIHSAAPLAHIVGPSEVVTLERSIDATAEQLGEDGAAYKQLFSPFTRQCDALLSDILGPLRFPRNPVLLARFGLQALQSADGLVKRRFRTPRARGLFAGLAAHSLLPLHMSGTASFGLALGMVGHSVGWPIALGGSSAITQALTQCLLDSGGELLLDHHVARHTDLPKARAYVFNLTPRQLVEIYGEVLPAGYRKRLKNYRHGAGVFKMDWALSGPIPWSNAACARATTVHISGDAEVIAASERAPYEQRVSEQPFVLLAQPTIVDGSRAPDGHHVAWAYCHVPHACDADYSELIESQIERHAPGFRSLILKRATKNARQMEGYNPNYIGGDINGGMADLSQLFFRPVVALDPYTTGLSNVFLCSSSTPPGGGVHGMCGYHAARSVMKHVFGRRLPDQL